MARIYFVTAEKPFVKLKIKLSGDENAQNRDKISGEKTRDNCESEPSNNAGHRMTNFCEITLIPTRWGLYSQKRIKLKLKIILVMSRSS